MVGLVGVDVRSTTTTKQFPLNFAAEMKTGRYWSKSDRKRHLIKQRDQKLRKQFMFECRQRQTSLFGSELSGLSGTDR